MYADFEHQIRVFETELEYQIPLDFLELLDGHCFGIFHDPYMVYLENDIEITWDILFLMRLPEEKHEAKYDVLRIIRSNPNLFGNIGDLKLFPIGTATLSKPSEDNLIDGYLGFDPQQQNKVVFISKNSEIWIEIAQSFHQMMINSRLLMLG